jgi:plasmid stability protein
MRTTLNLDDDVLAVVRERARRERRSVGEVLSDLARQALTGREPAAPAGAEFHGFRPLPHRGKLVSNDLIDQLREDEPE